MAIVHTVNGAALVAPASVQLADETNGFETQAKLGGVGIVSVFVDDPEGALTFTPHKQWLVSEDTAPSGQQVFWAGFIDTATWSRVGNGRVYPVGAGRVWEIRLVESNTYLVRRKLRKEATTTARPSETVSDRIDWLLTTDGMTGVVADAGLVAASSVVMDALTGDGYHNQDAMAVLRDCALWSGFNYHIRYREATDDYQLCFYDGLTSTLDTSSLLISNVAADVTGLTFAPNAEARGQILPDRIASGIIVVKSDGSDVYLTDATTATNYAEIDIVAPTPSVSTTTAATTLATHELDQHSTPEEVVECEIEVAADQVTVVKAGQLLSAKFTHGPGWESFRPCRATRVTPKRPANLTQGFYRIGLELQPAEPSEFVFTQAQLMDPSKGGLSELGYIGGGTYKPVVHLYDGDAPFPGGTLYPLTGLIEYIGSAGNRTGLRVLGSGTVTVTLAFSCSKVTSGGITFTAVIYNNASTQATVPHSVNDMGLTTYGWEPIHGTSLVTSFDVVSGDELTWSIHNNSNDVLSALPTGVGNVDHWFRVVGLLTA